MPFPLGHAAIGLAAHDLCFQKTSAFRGWKVLLFVAILANLPDVDIILGLLFQGNGNAFHRGPTHSLVFALAMGFLAANAWKWWARIPGLSFTICFAVILSHVMGDFFFTTSPVSLFWPLEVHWHPGFSGWADVLNSVFLETLGDVPIILGSSAVMVSAGLIRGYAVRAGALTKLLRFFARPTAPRPN